MRKDLRVTLKAKPGLTRVVVPETLYVYESALEAALGGGGGGGGALGLEKPKRLRSTSGRKFPTMYPFDVVVVGERDGGGGGVGGGGGGGRRRGASGGGQSMSPPPSTETLFRQAGQARLTLPAQGATVRFCALDSRTRREWLLLLKSRLHTSAEVTRLKHEYLKETHTEVCSLAQTWGVGRLNIEQRLLFYQNHVTKPASLGGGGGSGGGSPPRLASRDSPSSAQSLGAPSARAGGGEGSFKSPAPPLHLP